MRVTNRTFDGCYIDVPSDEPIVEIAPIPLDGLIYQIALSVRPDWQNSCSFADLAFWANLREIVPDLEEALQWCAKEEICVQLRCTEGWMNDRLAQRLKDWDQQYGTRAAKYLLHPDRKFVSHQLVFEHTCQLIVFRLRWC